MSESHHTNLCNGCGVRCCLARLHCLVARAHPWQVGHVAHDHISQHSWRQMAGNSHQGLLIFSSCKAAQNCKNLQKLCLGGGPRGCEEAWYLKHAGQA